MNKNEVETELNKYRNKYHIIEKYSPENVANWINEGNVVARCEGKMEFGQRALGNRSILADPRNQETITHINKLVKMYPDAFAKVKVDNESSLKLFESCGFKKKYYILEKC